MNDQTSPILTIVRRLTWMMVGPLALGLLVFPIVANPDGWFSVTDLTYLVVLAAMLLCRWQEFRAGNAETATGEPAMQEDLHRYIRVTGLVGMGIWVIANILGNYWRVSIGT